MSFEQSIGLALLIFSLSGTAQNPRQTNDLPQSAGTEVATLAINVDEVDLAFAVRDRHHRWVTDLTAGEIRLRDNGRVPESLRVFKQQIGLPLRAGLVVDVSDSVSNQFSFEKKAAASFIAQVLEPTKDLAFVMAFNSEPTMMQALTNDRAALTNAVQNLKLFGRTAIYDAVETGLNALGEGPETGLVRRVLIVVTDGDDNSSRLQVDDVINSALRSDVVVIVLNTRDARLDDSKESRAIERLARETGGYVFRADTKKTMAKAFAELNVHLRSYYLLGYRPTDFVRDGSYHKIELKTTRHGLNVVCRRGYYATEKHVTKDRLPFR